MSTNSRLKVQPAPITISLNGKTAGSVTSDPGLVIAIGSANGQIEWGSLDADVSVALYTNTFTASTIFQVSDDATNWKTIYSRDAYAYSAVAPAGNGSAVVTTNYAHSFDGNPSYKYLRLAVVAGTTTGGASDQCTVSYRFRQRTI